MEHQMDLHGVEQGQGRDQGSEGLASESPPSGELSGMRATQADLILLSGSEEGPPGQGPDSVV